MLLRFDPDIDVRPLPDAATTAGVPMRLVDIDDARIADLYERPLLLVRPDGQAGWRADAVDGPRALLARLTGRDMSRR